MMTESSFTAFQLEEAKEGREALIDHIKLISYNIFPDIFDYVSFENDDAFQEPLLYAFFNNTTKKNIDLLKSILVGYSQEENRNNIIIDFSNVSTSEDFLYFPKLGLLNMQDYHPEGKLSVSEFMANAHAFIQPLTLAPSSDIEIIPAQLDLLSPFYYDAGSTRLEVDVSTPYKNNYQYFTQAFEDISNQIDWFGELMKLTVKNAVLFNDNTDPYGHHNCKRNSFASMNINGISFHNCYQPWYDKVFFYDDIAHQMGHVIFYSMIKNKEAYFKVDPTDIFKPFNAYVEQQNVEERSYETVFHALYTYYTTLVVLDEMYRNNLKLSETQKQEVLGRIGFYLNKCHYDLLACGMTNGEENLEQIFTAKGKYVFDQFVATFQNCFQAYYPLTKALDYTGQTYNFNFHKFSQDNNAVLLPN